LIPFFYFQVFIYDFVIGLHLVYFTRIPVIDDGTNSHT